MMNKLDGLQWFVAFLVCFMLFGAGYVWRKRVRNKKARERLRLLLPEIRDGIRAFELLTNYENYFSNFEGERFLERNAGLVGAIPGYYKKIGLGEPDRQVITDFLAIYLSLPEKRKSYNDLFVAAESIKYAPLFNSLEKYPLSGDQIEAIVRDEDNTLVLAGAGTGKTTTISAKVAYLLAKGLAKPEELLIISFTKNAVHEMYDRCMKFCSDTTGAEKLEVRTFNGFGYFVTRLCSSQELLLAFDGNDEAAKSFLQERFSYLFSNDRNFQKKAVNFIAFFSRPARDEFCFETLHEFLIHEKSFKNITLDGKVVNSKEEMEICNFLCLFKIDYEYQRHYPLQTEDRNANFSAYRPDFYFPQYELWHEHYGIDREGNVPSWFSKKHPGQSAKDTYHAGILWKEAIHQKYGTKLIKTYSYESGEGSLLHNLKLRLEAHGVIFERRSPEELQDLIQSSGHFDDFMGLVYTYLGLLKSNGQVPGDISVPRGDKRLKTFLEVFKPLFEAYESQLKLDHAVDYSDMVNLAGRHIRIGDYSKPYKYILVDEFQDMSLGRYELLKSLRRQNPAVKLYAVGDDWQSIFRFSGSDLSIITRFEKHFGVTHQSAILTTYRFNQQILQVTGGFIQKNPAQLKKQLLATRGAKEPAFVFHGLTYGSWGMSQKHAVKLQRIQQLLNEISLSNPKASVFLIGRYRYNNPPGLQQLKKEFPTLKLSFYTAHSVKGLTADYAILLDLDSGIFGFPSEMADDPILNSVLYEDDKFENAEERRLFYVALTRARHQNHLLFDGANPSKFVTELQILVSKNATSAFRKCPECHGVLVKRSGEYGEFYGCMHYPHCKGKENSNNYKSYS